MPRYLDAMIMRYFIAHVSRCSAEMYNPDNSYSPEKKKQLDLYANEIKRIYASIYRGIA